MEQEKQLDRMDGDNGEVNPYRVLIVNNAEKIEMQKSQMEQWSILSNSLNYVQHSKFNSMDHSLNICPVNRYKVKPNASLFSSGKEFREVGFGINLQNLQTKYRDVYEGPSFRNKNVFELESVINSRDCRFKFLNRSVPIYPEKELILKPNEQKLVKV